MESTRCPGEDTNFKTSQLGTSITNVIEGIQSKPVFDFGNPFSHINQVLISAQGKQLLFKNSQPIKHFLHLIYSAEINDKNIMFIVRNSEIKSILLGYLEKENSGKTSFLKSKVYIETIDDVTRQDADAGIHVESIQGGNICFFDIPNIGKRYMVERDFIKYCTTLQNTEDIQVIFSNFSDKFKSNKSLRNSLTQSYIHNEPEGDVKQMHDSEKHGNLNICEIQKGEEGEESYKHIIMTLQQIVGKRIIFYKEGNIESLTSQLGQKSISFDIMSESRIFNYEHDDETVLLIKSNLVGYYDISAADSVILADYLSLDKTRKIAKELLYKGKDSEKKLYYQRQIVAGYEQDNPKANIFGEVDGIDDDIRKNSTTDQTKKKSSKEQKTPNYTAKLEYILGLQEEADLKRLSDEMLLEKIRIQLQETFKSNKMTTGENFTDFIITFPLGELRKWFNSIPALMEMQKRKKIASSGLQKLDYINFLNNLGFLIEFDFESIQRLKSKKSTIQRMSNEDLKATLEKLLGSDLKTKLIKKFKENLEGLGIARFHDFLLLGSKIPKPEGIKIPQFNHIGDTSQEEQGFKNHIYSNIYMNLYIRLYCEDIIEGKIKQADIPKLAHTLYSYEDRETSTQESIFLINKEILAFNQNFPIESGSSSNKLRDILENVVGESDEKMALLYTTFCEHGAKKIQANIGALPRFHNWIKNNGGSLTYDNIGNALILCLKNKGIVNESSTT